MMRFSLSNFLPFLLILTLVASGAAQKPSTNAGVDDSKGFTEFETFQGTINSEGSILRLDSTLGYDFNRHFGVLAGLPIYFAHVSSNSTTTGTTPTGTTSSYTNTGVGNAYLGFVVRLPNPTLDYSTAVTVGAPTGSTSDGFSSGRASIDWTNRFEHSFDRLNPFFEAGLANTVPDSAFFTRPFTSLGAVSHLEEGAGFDLIGHFSVGASAYQIVPFGNQKVFSKLVKKGQAARGPGTHGRAFETAATASGNDLTRENGFNTWVAFEPSPLWRLEAGYTHSMTFALDSFAFNLRMNVGRMFRARKNS
jgi:hypothetical protein